MAATVCGLGHKTEKAGQLERWPVLWSIYGYGILSDHTINTAVTPRTSGVYH